MVPAIRPYFEIDEEAMQTVAAALASGHVSNNGRHVQEFERQLAEYLGVSETVAVSTGSDALLLSLKALVLPRGKAILPAYTYIATLNAVMHSGLDPVFCDIEPDTFTLSTEHLRQLLLENADVRCVVAVNVFGVPPDLAAIRKLCDPIGAKLVYDNAHGFGTVDAGRRIAREPDVQTFSFHATKTLPAVEGGLIVSGDPEIVSMVKRLRNHGLASNQADAVAGFNAKMDELRAIIGTYSLKHFPETLARRRAYGDRLMEAFRRHTESYTPQVIPESVQTNYQNLGVCCHAANQVGIARVVELFGLNGVAVRPYFDPPLYKFTGIVQAPALPVTEAVWRTLVSVPIHSHMSETALGRIEKAAEEVADTLRAAH